MDTPALAGRKTPARLANQRAAARAPPSPRPERAARSAGTPPQKPRRPVRPARNSRPAVAHTCCFAPRPPPTPNPAKQDRRRIPNRPTGLTSLVVRGREGQMGHLRHVRVGRRGVFVDARVLLQARAVVRRHGSRRRLPPPGPEGSLPFVWWERERATSVRGAKDPRARCGGVVSAGVCVWKTTRWYKGAGAGGKGREYVDAWGI